MCERVWRIAQDCTKKQELAAGSSGWLAAASRQNVAHVPSMPEAKESRQLLHYKTKVSGWPGRLFMTWTRDSTQSRGQVTRTPYLGKIDFSHSFSPYYIYPWFKESFQREFWETNPREKQDWLIYNLYLRDFSKSSTLFLFIVKSLRGLLPKPFLTISISMKGLFGALGSS